MKEFKISHDRDKAINILSMRWNGLIICFLMNGPKRFQTISSSLGISGRMLSERLKELVRLEIVNREIIPETPVRIEYSLTEKGLSFKPILNEIEKWSNKWERTN
ncbi:transcriptional regulator [Oceanobacillus sp. 143]|jgi:DNA-binding HxlR family transcriptional regulator|uniref:Transcriptional regulator n=1 Tax=Oceanobacillus zhaokaii TaxID=2052660 RepID=A0A345PGW6_9BACI|nr:winged helix-turn-helix transcriptional regulator [Oceanobacillus zhaokaii]AXI09246.1 transcriptional regulator [Oceanobacillus zhaokaii]QGS68757.1 transcriptional regulator [Oceanobacillus sp. 143]